MYETENPAVRWLRLLLYVGIIGMVFQLLRGFLPPMVGTVSGYVLSAVTLFLFFQLIVSNSRYKKAMLFSGATLILAALNNPSLAMAATICKYVGHYQEFYAHGELAATQDPALGSKWTSLFWFHLAVEFAGTVLLYLIASGAGASAYGSLIAMGTVVVSFISIGLRVVYLVYLGRTIRVLKAEVVV